MNPRILDLGSCAVDLGRHRIVRGAEVVGLTPLEVGLVAALAERPGVPVTRDELLVRVWGYRPGVATRAVDKTVARLRAKLELGPEGPHLTNVRGVGYCLDGVRTQQTTEQPRATEDDVAGAWVDRVEARQLELLLRDPTARVITLLGPGGIGKTRLARRASASFADGSVFVDLTEVRSGAAAVARVAEALAVAPAGPDVARAVGEGVAARGCLVVLDNAEQIAAELAPIAARWASSGRFLVTSRERLKIQAERVLPLEPLAAAAATELFVDRARRADPAFDPDGLDADAWARIGRIVARVEGMPLAVELAAARVRTLGLARLEERLGADPHALASDRRDAPPRQASLDATLRWSWDLLTDAERAVLAQVALFAHPFDPGDVEAVVDPGVRGDAMEILGSLVDKSLVRTEVDEEGEPRFRLFEAVRAFALAVGDPDTLARLRLAHRMAARTESLARIARALHGERAMRELLRLRDTAIAAFDTAEGAGEVEVAVRLGLGLAPALAAVGPATTAERVLGRTVALARTLDAPTAARALAARGAVRANLAELDGARVDLEEALACAPAADDLRSALLSELGHVARLQANLTGAFASYAEAVAIPSADDDPARALLFARFGRACANVGRLDEAERHLARALAIARAVGSAGLQAEVLVDQGFVAEERGDVVAATDLYEEAIGLTRFAGDRRGEAMARLALGTVWMTSCDVARGQPMLGDAADALGAVGNRRAQAIATCHLGLCQLAAGAVTDALRTLHSALALLDGVGDEVNVGVVETNLAEAHHLAGDLDGARAVLERALARVGRGGVDALVGGALAQLGAVLADRGDVDAAAAHLADAEVRFARHPKLTELKTLAIRQLHLALARARIASDGDAVDRVRHEAIERDADTIFERLARRQLARACGPRTP